MKMIGVIDNGYEYDLKKINRKVVRGIGIKEGKVLMIYSDRYDNYFFPGGGKRYFETAEECLKREIKEETGIVIKNISKPIGYIDEVKMHRNNYLFVQRTSYYFYEIDRLESANRERHEASYETVLVSLEEAIEKNNKVTEDLNFVKRELMVLNKLKGDYYERIQGRKRIRK